MNEIPKSLVKELFKLEEVNKVYKTQLDLVIDELKNIYGKSPFDLDCDYFIDTFVNGCAEVDIDELHRQMMICLQIQV